MSYSSLVQLINNGFHGSHGNPGYHGTAGGYGGGYGSRGGRGGDGARAGDAGNVNLIMRVPDSGTISLEATLGPRTESSGSSNVYLCRLGDSDAEVIMSAIGGDGGHGGRGGDGGPGGTGVKGVDATQYSSGGNGGPGGDGGDGGDGGNGGNGGHGADIRVHVNQIDMDVLMLLKQKVSPTYGGKGGSGGAGGYGGPGGAGGPGGCSYSWTETTYYTDANGNSQASSTTYTNPGGYPGPPGRSGCNGNSGVSGSDGRDGSYAIQLGRVEGQVETYYSPYDLAVRTVRYVDTVGYQVIEPACSVYLNPTLANVGGMPTPSHQLIRSYVADNRWVTCDVADRVPLQTWIEPNVEVGLSKPILFTVTDVDTPSRGEPFKATGVMEHRALVDRVNQDFKRVRDTPTDFTIEYPVYSSLIKGGVAISFGEEAPLVYFMHNRAVLGLGVQAQPSRYLSTEVNLDFNTKGGHLKLESNEICLRDASGVVFPDSAAGLFSEITNLYPSSRQYFTSTLQFVNPNTKPYTRITVESSLHLGHVKNMLQPKNIQIRGFEVQLAESYCRNDNAKVLIVVNNRTEYDEVQSWRGLLQRLDITAEVWNVSLYGDLCLNHVRNDGSTLVEDFCCRNIIFLNNLYLKEEKMCDASEYMRARELFYAARDHGINTLFFGSTAGIDFSHELIPATANPAAISYFQSRSAFLKNVEERLMPGKGDVQGFPASAPSDLCGCLKYKKKIYWCTLHLEAKTLCYYASARQQYPDGMLYLESFGVRAPDNPDEPGASFEIFYSGDCSIFTVPKPNEYQGKKDRYGNRENFTTGASQWIKLLQPLAVTSSSLTKGNSKQLLGESLRDSRDLSGDKVEKLTGYLKKRGFEWFASYKKYFFEFDPTLKTLSYYKDEKSLMKPKGSLFLGRYSLQSGDFWGKEKGGELKFQILTASRSLFLQAESIAEKERWIDGLAEMAPPVDVPVNHVEQSAPLQDKIQAEQIQTSFPAIQKTLLLQRSQSVIISRKSSSAKLSTNTPLGLRKKLAAALPSNEKSSELSTSLDQSGYSSLPSEVLSSSSSISSSSSGFPPTPITPDGSSTNITHSVARIAVEEKFLITSPTEKKLKKKAKGLYKKLEARFPNQRNVIVYEFNTNSKKEKRGFATHHVGQLEVYRSLDCTNTHLVHLPAADADIHNPSVIDSHSTVYHFLKSLEYKRKLILLNREMQNKQYNIADSYLSDNSTLLGLVMMAVLSDIADEQYHFRQSNWKQGINTQMMRSRLQKLEILNHFEFTSFGDQDDRLSSLAGDVLLELGTHIQIIVRCHSTSVWDKILPGRRSTNVSKATLGLWDQIMITHLFNGHKPDSQSKSKASQRMKQKKKSWKQFGAGSGEVKWGYKGGKDPAKKIKSQHKIILQSYHHPPKYGDGETDSYASVPKVMSKQQFVDLVKPPRADKVRENRFVFNSQEARSEGIAEFQREFGCPSGTETNLRCQLVPGKNSCPPPYGKD